MDKDMPVDEMNFLSSNLSNNVDTFFRATGDEKMTDTMKISAITLQKLGLK
jgi:hypothetical protein